MRAECSVGNGSSTRCRDAGPGAEAAASVGEVETQVVESLRDLEATEWDELTIPGDLFGSYAWLRHLDLATGRTHRAVVARVGGRLVGAIPIWEGEREPGGLFSLPGFFPDLPGEWMDRPFAWLGTRRSVRNGLTCVGDRRRAGVLASLLATATDVARAGGRSGVIMPYLPVDIAAELAAAHRDALMLLHSAEAVVYVPGRGTQDLFEQAGGHNRRRRRRELRDFTANGYTLEWTDVTPEVAESVAPLIAGTRSKYGNDQGTAWIRRVFTAQREVGLLNSAKALLCRRAGRLAFAAVCYRHADTLHGRYFGADAAASRNGYPYFVTTCYAPVDYATQEGLRRVFLSVSSLEAKVRRGARLDPLAAVVLDLAGGVDEQTAHSHNIRFAQDHLDRFAGRPNALGPGWLGFGSRSV